MTPAQFVRSPGWKRRKSEVMLEILAVCLPIGIYAIALGVSDWGLRLRHEGYGGLSGLEHLWLIPDGFFGGCVLFAFSTIHGFRHQETAASKMHAAHDEISFWRLIGLAGLIVSSLLAAIAVMFHPWWALAGGSLSLYLGGLSYKKIVFCRTYLRSIE